MFDKLKMVEKRYNHLNDLLSDPKIIAQQSEFQRYAKEQSDLTPNRKQVSGFTKVCQAIGGD